MIKIIRGTFGHRNGNIIEAKTANSEAFEALPEVEERLIKKGVAVRVEAERQTEEKKNKAEGENPSMSDSDREKMQPEGVEPPTYSEENTVKELKEICAQYEIELPRNANKNEILAAMDIVLKNDAPPAIDATEAIK